MGGEAPSYLRGRGLGKGARRADNVNKAQALSTHHVPNGYSASQVAYLLRPSGEVFVGEDYQREDGQQRAAGEPARDTELPHPVIQPNYQSDHSTN